MIDFDPWGPIVAVLFEAGSSDYILGVLQRSGVPTDFGLTKEEAYSHNTRKRAYRRRLDPVLAQLSPEARRRVAQNVGYEVAKSENGLERLNAALERIGWRFENDELRLLSPSDNNSSLPKEPSSIGPEPHLLSESVSSPQAEPPDTPHPTPPGTSPAFFSYCRADSDFVLRLAGDLKTAGANVWMDQLDIVGGSDGIVRLKPR